MLTPTRTRIYLRLLTINDASQTYLSWINNTNTNKYLDTKKSTLMDLKSYIIGHNSRSDSCLFGIFTLNENQHIGNIKLEPFDVRYTLCGCIGIMIGNEKYRGCGYGSEAINILCKYAFHNLGLNSIMLGVKNDHIAAIKCYTKCGFMKLSEIPNNHIDIKNVLQFIHNNGFKESNDSSFFVKFKYKINKIPK